MPNRAEESRAKSNEAPLRHIRIQRERRRQLQDRKIELRQEILRAHKEIDRVANEGGHSTYIIWDEDRHLSKARRVARYLQWEGYKANAKECENELQVEVNISW